MENNRVERTLTIPTISGQPAKKSADNDHIQSSQVALSLFDCLYNIIEIPNISNTKALWLLIKNEFQRSVPFYNDSSIKLGAIELFGSSQLAKYFVYGIKASNLSNQFSQFKKHKYQLQGLDLAIIYIWGDWCNNNRNMTEGTICHLTSLGVEILCYQKNKILSLRAITHSEIKHNEKIIADTIGRMGAKQFPCILYVHPDTDPAMLTFLTLNNSFLEIISLTNNDWFKLIASGKPLNLFSQQTASYFNGSVSKRYKAFYRAMAIFVICLAVLNLYKFRINHNMKYILKQKEIAVSQSYSAFKSFHPSMNLYEAYINNIIQFKNTYPEPNRICHWLFQKVLSQFKQKGVEVVGIHIEENKVNIDLKIMNWADYITLKSKTSNYFPQIQWNIPQYSGQDIWLMEVSIPYGV